MGILPRLLTRRRPFKHSQYATTFATVFPMRQQVNEEFARVRSEQKDCTATLQTITYLCQFSTVISNIERKIYTHMC